MTGFERTPPCAIAISIGTTLLFLLTKQIPADLPRRKLKIDFRDRVNISTEFSDWIEIFCLVPHRAYA
ncbi:hypothetical protein [Aerosakkonema funiforme]|uniref:Uncharacterized protein n=1 Tax=Aerosakkonema funiforme FACHB-1375 TaxID=2949571 RepID=A0A926VHE8_9CYAN|nr:hypothetical protein [Aerosakkonema funiforme]MBD2183842.1 hypothetical protein [Aerosakkonema funiforme FACHB-1375]